MDLTPSQFRLLADFFNDLAKGFLLGSFLDPNLFHQELFPGLLIIVFKSSLALLFLYLAVLYTKEGNLYEI